jgi:hypothetical protein
MTPRTLRISKGWIEAWAAEYGDYDSSRVDDLLGKSRPTYDDIERVYRWKSSRSVGHFLDNDPEHVVSAVRSALRAKGDAAALARVEILNGRIGTRSWTGERGKPWRLSGTCRSFAALHGRTCGRST